MRVGRCRHPAQRRAGVHLHGDGLAVGNREVDGAAPAVGAVLGRGGGGGPGLGFGAGVGANTGAGTGLIDDVGEGVGAGTGAGLGLIEDVGARVGCGPREISPANSYVHSPQGGPGRHVSLTVLSQHMSSAAHVPVLISSVATAVALKLEVVPSTASSLHVARPESVQSMPRGQQPLRQIGVNGK